MLYEQGVDVVLSAHEHLYERYAPMSPDGQRNDARGIRQFIVGTGGAGLYTVMRAHPQSEVQLVSHGLLKLTLDARELQLGVSSAEWGTRRHRLRRLSLSFACNSKCKMQNAKCVDRLHLHSAF